jgi:serine protease Do
MARGLNGSANGAGHWPPPGEEGVVARTPGSGSNLPPLVAAALPAVVGVKTTIPETRRSAQTLGTEREGHGILVDEEGLVLTIGYLIMEADTVTVTDIDGNELSRQRHLHRAGLPAVGRLRPDRP